VHVWFAFFGFIYQEYALTVHLFFGAFMFEERLSRLQKNVENKNAQMLFLAMTFVA